MTKYTECELLEMVRGDTEVWVDLDTEVCDRGRWHDYMSTVVKHKDTGELLGIDWERGLTENQEDCYTEQPYAVEAYEEVIPQTVVTKWRRVPDQAP